MKNSAGEKSSFLLYKDRRPLVEGCDDEKAGQLFKAIYRYVCDGNMPEFDDPMLNGIFSMFRESIDADTQKWKEKCEKAKAATDKRWGKN